MEDDRWRNQPVEIDDPTIKVKNLAMAIYAIETLFLREMFAGV